MEQNIYPLIIEEIFAFFLPLVSEMFAKTRKQSSGAEMRYYSKIVTCDAYCGRPWPAAYINFNQNIHQIQVLTKPLCHAQAIFYSLPNNEWGTKYRGLTYSAK